ncbi:MAG: HTH-type transcriptional regulator celR [Microbacteriaceae bacterium]|nr:HTH-type transcriptional regulator celR [Microbacteriaceae bacterium]
MTIKKPANIRDIAALAGVSAGTVSRVMNDKPGVGSETRAHIARLITEYDFRGDSNARQLSLGRSDSLGVVFPLQVSEVVMHPVYPELLGSISDAALASGYDVSLFTTTAEERVEHIVDAFKRKRVDGLILPAASSDDALIQRVVDEGIPTVLVGHRQESARMTWVDCTHDQAIFDIATAMIGSGRTRLVLLNGPKRVSAYQLRSDGFWRAANDARLVDAQEIELGMSYSSGLQAAGDLFTLPRPPDAIVCSADSTAAGVLEEFKRAGIAIPMTAEVSGFDDTDFASHSTPQLTSVRMPLRETGAAAVSLLLNMIDDRTAHPAPRLLDAEVVWRASTSPVGGV